MDVKKQFFGGYKLKIYSGTKTVDFSPVEFAKLMEEKGAGEIIVQSIDRDGTMKGYDLELIKSISEAVTIPVIALGGAGSFEDLKVAYKKAYASALAAGSLFVFKGKNRGVLINYFDREKLNLLKDEN